MKLESSQTTEEWNSFAFGFSVYREVGDTEEIYSRQIKNLYKDLNKGFIKLGSPLRAFGYHFEEAAQIGLIGNISVIDTAKAPEQAAKWIEDFLKN